MSLTLTKETLKNRGHSDPSMILCELFLMFREISPSLSFFPADHLAREVLSNGMCNLLHDHAMLQHVISFCQTFKFMRRRRVKISPTSMNYEALWSNFTALNLPPQTCPLEIYVLCLPPRKSIIACQSSSKIGHSFFSLTLADFLRSCQYLDYKC